MSPHGQFDYEEKRGFGRRFGFALGVLAVLGVGVFLVSQVFANKKSAPARKAQEIVSIKPIATPPPPPPPPPPTEPPKQQMEEQSPVDPNEAKPDEAPDPSPVMGTNIAVNGPPDGFGLSGNKSGLFDPSHGRGGGGGSRFGWYANEVREVLSEALRNNPQTRTAKYRIKVRVWSDATGRITRAKLAASTGDPAVDQAIQRDVLEGRQLKNPPPADMAMPIVLRLGGS